MEDWIPRSMVMTMYWEHKSKEDCQEILAQTTTQQFSSGFIAERGPTRKRRGRPLGSKNLKKVIRETASDKSLDGQFFSPETPGNDTTTIYQQINGEVQGLSAPIRRGKGRPLGSKNRNKGKKSIEYLAKQLATYLEARNSDSKQQKQQQPEMAPVAI